MRRDLLAFFSGCFCLGGCGFLGVMLPHKATTTAEALSAMHQCEVALDSISWRVTDDGAFAFGKRSADAPPVADRQSDCLMKWAKDNRVEVHFIGWETDGG